MFLFYFKCDYHVDQIRHQGSQGQQISDCSLKCVNVLSPYCGDSILGVAAVVVKFKGIFFNNTLVEPKVTSP